MSIAGIKLMIASEQGNKAAELFAQALDAGKIKRYRKFGWVYVRIASAGEVVVTTVNGKEETRNTAKKGDYVVKSPTGEQYIIDAKKLEQRYRYIDRKPRTSIWAKYKPVGECFGFRYKGPEFKFTAPWGELMLVEDGDMIVSTSPEGGNDIYRIEKEASKSTYKLAGGYS